MTQAQLKLTERLGALVYVYNFIYNAANRVYNMLLYCVIPAALCFSNCIRIQMYIYICTYIYLFIYMAMHVP